MKNILFAFSLIASVSALHAMDLDDSHQKMSPKNLARNKHNRTQTKKNQVKQAVLLERWYKKQNLDTQNK